MASTSRASSRLQWRVIDIVTAAVLGVACGLIFWVWNTVGYAGFTAMDALTPGLGGLFNGVWFLGGIIGGLVIRKPGAAIFVEVLAACVSAVLGSQWGIETIYSGLAQGIGAELVFAAFAYRRFSLTTSVLAGVGAGIGAFLLELFTAANLAMSLSFNLIYLLCTAISGALLAGVLGWMLVRALAQTGALDRFGPGRERFATPAS
ncbi:ECF transporter S component [Corynebacterium sanguinis]|uniref:ECF transporter S component n=1 Tax=Corynebacterium sanguinis TaxID=2594913 RepID=UPI0021A39D09|nr:ECF transporter S component [Corynebacterium sanguinis]MCT1463843.1 ECF transporter S component [Corynebacterium sanguinis]MCT2328754.1 ECF transporter S component [Corynebacterium sanguinis]